MKILIFSNIPSPYRIEFFNELGKKVDLTVVFEAKTAVGIKFNWKNNQIQNFKAIFLKEGDINEKRVNWSILKYVKRDRYDHIIVTSYAYYTEMTALIALKFLRIPYFLEIDGGLIREERKIKKLFKTFLISSAAGYLSPSKSSDAYLVYYGANKELIYRYPFSSLKDKDILINPILYEEKLKFRKELGITEKKIVLAVGRFIHSKGFDVLLNASKYLKEDIGVYFVGGEPTEEYLSIKHNNLLEHVYFEGFKSKEELSKYYKAADVFALPTRDDVWGLVINEAMGYGLPVISTNKCVAALELVKPNVNGYIIQVDDVETLAEKINEIFLDINIKEKVSMGKHSLSLIRQYTIENMTREHIKVFQMNLKNYRRQQ